MTALELPPPPWRRGREVLPQPGDSSKRRRSHGPTATAAAGAAAQYIVSSAVAAPRVLYENRRLLMFCLGWYICSSITNTLNKQVLNAFPLPITVTYLSFWTTVIYGYLFGLVLPFARPQSAEWRIFRVALPYSICRIASHSLSSVALSIISVSFMHTLKAISPLFTVALSRLFLGTRVSRPVLFSLLPICGGILVACASEIDFQLPGAIAATASVLVIAFQAILSKGVFMSTDLNEFSMLYYSSAVSAVLMTPVWLLSEGRSLLLNESGDAGGLNSHVVGMLLVSGLAQYLHGIFGFATLTVASALTYSIASVAKRVVVIVVSILWLGNSVQPMGYVGAAITFLGVLLYNDAVRRTAPASPRRKFADKTAVPGSKTSPAVSRTASWSPDSSVGDRGLLDVGSPGLWPYDKAGLGSGQLRPRMTTLSTLSADMVADYGLLAADISMDLQPQRYLV